MAAPPDRFRAHDCGRPWLTSEGEKPLDALVEFLRLHVIGVSANCSSAPGGWLGAPSKRTWRGRYLLGRHRESKRKVRECQRPSPTRETRALPRVTPSPDRPAVSYQCAGLVGGATTSAIDFNSRPRSLLVEMTAVVSFSNATRITSRLRRKE